jgi:phosphotransferase system HPr-like phosphotransfer protein
MLGINALANFTVSAIGKDAQIAIKAIKDFFDSSKRISERRRIE